MQGYNENQPPYDDVNGRYSSSLWKGTNCERADVSSTIHDSNIEWDPVKKSLGGNMSQSPTPMQNLLQLDEMYYRIANKINEMQALIGQWFASETSESRQLPEAQSYVDNIANRIQMFQCQLDATLEARKCAAAQSEAIADVITTSRPNTVGGEGIAIVEFRRRGMQRFCCNSFISPGKYVIVDGDRGQDCGLLVYCSCTMPGTTETRVETMDSSIDPSTFSKSCGGVHNVATQEQVDKFLYELPINESVALEKARQMVEKQGLPMKIDACEYQFDCKKISFFFDSNEAVDFRQLTTKLYRTFGVRIWMENQSGNVKRADPRKKIHK